MTKRSDKKTDCYTRIINENAQVFSHEIAKWRIDFDDYNSNRHPPKSPPVSEELKTLLVESMKEQVRAFARAETLSKRPGTEGPVAVTHHFRALIASSPAQTLYIQLMDDADIRNYARTPALRKKLVTHLVGSVIARAIDTAIDIGVEAPHINDEFFADPSREPPRR